jgi:hypothetical protein
MAVVLEAVALGAARREWRHRVEAIERVNRGIVIEAAHRCTLWRIEIWTNDFGGVRFRVHRAPPGFRYTPSVGLLWFTSVDGRIAAVLRRPSVHG